ncbi:MAG: LytTR family transcriptional regulator DNA-binding domain-containing protein [Bacilli bacterium]
MIKFVIVEDNPYQQKVTSKYILNYMFKNDFEFKIITFPTETKELLDLIEAKEDNTIYILDYELPVSSAMDISHIIREEDWSSPIIIHTIYSSMALPTFKKRLQILDFVSKNKNAEKNLHELFDICFKQLHICKSLKFKTATKDYNIAFDKILYITRDTITRKALIYTKNQVFEMSKPLKYIKKILPQYFLFSHKACIINMRKVESIDWSKTLIYFDNGSTIQLLTISHKKELMEYVPN